MAKTNDRSALRARLATWCQENGGTCIRLGSFNSALGGWLGATYRFETSLGPWEVTLPSDDSSNLLSICTRFLALPADATLPMDVNPFSGKWNFHLTDNPGSESYIFRMFTIAAERAVFRKR